MSEVLNEYAREISAEKTLSVDQLAQKYNVQVEDEQREPQKLTIKPEHIPPQGGDPVDALAAKYGVSSDDTGPKANESDVKRQESANRMGDQVKGAGQGIFNAVTGMWNGFVELLDGVDGFGTIHGQPLGKAVSPELVDKLQIDPMGKPTDPTAQQATRAIIQYATPAVAAYGLTGGVGALTATAIGAGLDFLALDPHQQRLSTLVREEVPSLKNHLALYNIIDSLSNRPDETELEGRLKNSVEGLLVGGGLIMTGKVLAKVFTGGVTLSKGAKTYLGYNKPIKIASESEVVTAEMKMGANVAPEVRPTDATLSETLFDDGPTRVGVDGATRPNFNNDGYMDFLKEYSKGNANDGATAYQKTTWADLDAEARAILTDPAKLENLFKWKQGERTLTGSEIKATHYFMADSVDQAVDLAEKAIRSKNDADIVEAIQALDVFKFINNIKEGNASAMGMGFGVNRVSRDLFGSNFKEMAKSLTVESRRKVLQELMSLSGGKEQQMELLTRVAALKAVGVSSEEALTKFAQASRNGPTRGAEILSSIAINGLLSNTTIPMANAIANTITTGMTVADNATAWATSNILGVVGRRPQDAITINQQTKYIRGMAAGLLEVPSAMWQQLKGSRTGHASLVVKADVKAGSHPFVPPGVPGASTITSPELEIGHGLYGKTVSMLSSLSDHVVGMPARLTGVPDAIFGTIMMRGKSYQIASQNAERAGLQGKELSAFVKNTANNLTGAENAEVVQFAQANTFSKALDPESWVGGVENLIDKTPLGKVLSPFWRTNANIIEYTVQHSPFSLMNLPLVGDVNKRVFGSSVRDALARGGAEAEMARAKIINGSLFLGGAAWLASEGLTTGPEPANWKVKQALDESGQGPIPNAFKIGDTYVSYNRIDPMASFLRLGNVIAGTRNHIAKGEYEQLVAYTSAAVADMMTPEMMVEGWSRYLEAYNEAIKYEGDSRKMQDVFVNTMSRFIPYSGFLRQVKNLYDPYKPDMKTDPLGEGIANGIAEVTNSVVNRYKGIVPWHTEEMPIQRNMFGDPLHVPPGVLAEDYTADGQSIPIEDSKPGAWEVFLSPFAVSHGKGDPLVQKLKYLANYQVSSGGDFNRTLDPLPLQMPSRIFSYIGTQVELTPEEYERLILYTAGRDPVSGNPIAGRSLRDNMGRAVDAIWPQLKSRNMTPVEYNALVGAISEQYVAAKEVGKAMLFAEPEFKEKVMKSLKHRTMIQQTMPSLGE